MNASLCRFLRRDSGYYLSDIKQAVRPEIKHCHNPDEQVDDDILGQAPGPKELQGESASCEGI